MPAQPSPSLLPHRCPVHTFWSGWWFGEGVALQSLNIQDHEVEKSDAASTNIPRTHHFCCLKKSIDFAFCIYEKSALQTGFKNNPSRISVLCSPSAGTGCGCVCMACGSKPGTEQDRTGLGHVRRDGVRLGELCSWL